MTISDGDPIDLKFNGSLRDTQIPVVDTYMKHAKKYGGGLLELHTGFGKTCCALKIIAKLKRKTIIIVHKDFLLRQWVERIEQFLPDAKVGKIQGKIIDIEGKDIVIGMLQSISMKEYDKNIFSCFGLTVIDECHHISAEVFSRSLLKIVTRYTLGLSATMKRKDGLTHVIKKFLGEIVYTKKREGKDKVTVKAIEYYHEDEEFSHTELNWRKQVQYSKMIKKICEFNRRSEFVLEVLKHTLQHGDDDIQIMILGHNRNLLTYLHDAIKHRDIASVGFYVGGMKEADLKISETKKVIIATYAMAEEGLDIKSLNALIMATPKVDVTQAVGRILRKKESEGLVIDIIDQHPLFQRHWTKRRAFYRKQNFTIQKTYMEGYKNGVWEDISKRGKKKKKKPKKEEKYQSLLDFSDM
jgi:superfamily II DNA or RNA helicase